MPPVICVPTTSSHVTSFVNGDVQPRAVSCRWRTRLTSCAYDCTVLTVTTSVVGVMMKFGVAGSAWNGGRDEGNFLFSEEDLLEPGVELVDAVTLFAA